MEILNLFAEIWNAKHEHLIPFVMVYSLLAMAVCIMFAEVQGALYMRSLRKRARAEVRRDREIRQLTAHREAVRDFHSEVEAWQAAVKQLEGKRHLKLVSSRE